jgi:hypothetical protein
VADLEIAVRDRIGRGLFTAGSALYWLGGHLCGLAGWWDAGTDGRKMRKGADRG